MINKTPSSQLYRRITRWRWQTPLLAFLLVLGHQLIEHTWLMFLSRWYHFATQLFFYGLVGPFLAWWALTSLRRRVGETEKAENALKKAHHTLSQVNEQLACLLRVNHRLTEVKDEETLLAVLLELPLEVVPAVGCSLIPFDERQQMRPALHHGNLQTAVLDAWVGQMSEVLRQQQCHRCVTQTATAVYPCPLFNIIPESLNVGQMICLKLARNERAFGILTVYLPPNYALSESEKSLLQTIAQEMSLALESHQLRAQELAMLTHLQQIYKAGNLDMELVKMLTHTVEALEVDGGLLLAQDTETAVLQVKIEAGNSLEAALPMVKGLARGVEQTDKPLIIRELEQVEQADVQSLLIAPLRTDEQTVGSLVLWAARPNAFNRRRTQLVTIVAGQAALLLENQRLYLEGEYRAILTERARLAREIHDGLAQTLGYLKLRTTQIGHWLTNGEYGRVNTGVAEVRRLMDAAYIDAREAIDGLHLRSHVSDTTAWVHEIVSEFELLTGIPVETAVPAAMTLLPEVQVQLQRIIQEALSNIRKHAQATAVKLDWQAHSDEFSLQISDNGCGFDLDDVPPIARHGLRIMRERAELLQADFQITSHRNEGTQIGLALSIKQVTNGSNHE